jgi:intracellular sulfur oxidation DsrE/DsrF family protein
MTHLTYEAFLDEVTTIITELYELEDEAAIKLVVDAQSADFFVAHDNREEMRTHEQAKKDAVTLFEAKQNTQLTQKQQQLRVRDKKEKPR